MFPYMPKDFFNWLFRLAFIGILTIIISSIGIIGILIYFGIHHLRFV